MKAAAVILFVLSLAAADIVDVGVITDTEGLAIKTCHPGDIAMVEVIPVNPAPDRVRGFFETTETLLTSKSPPMTMAPTGTNIARIRTVCSGSTSEVREVRFVIRREIPAPKVARGRVARPVVIAQYPPLPGGLVMPFPNATNYSSYQEYLRRLESGKRRSE